MFAGPDVTLLVQVRGFVVVLFEGDVEVVDHFAQALFLNPVIQFFVTLAQEPPVAPHNVHHDSETDADGDDQDLYKFGADVVVHFNAGQDAMTMSSVYGYAGIGQTR